MFVLSRTTRELVTGGEACIQRLRKFSPFDAQENRVEPCLEGDAEVTVQQIEMLERIRVAAGQTS
jgi:hypothetical protein